MLTSTTALHPFARRQRRLRDPHGLHGAPAATCLVPVLDQAVRERARLIRRLGQREVEIPRSTRSTPENCHGA
ncbi:hypothetical protein ACU686_03120 [Yinghuangia aomiensis]